METSAAGSKKSRQTKKIFSKSYSCSYIDTDMVNGKLDYVQQEDLKVKVKDFRKLIVDILEPHHDDQYLMKWLKARDYDLAKAERMIRESFKFRKKVGADKILNSGYQVPEVYEKYPICERLGFCKENSIVRLFMAGTCDYKGYVYSINVFDIMKLLIYFLESDLNMIREKKKKVGKLEEKTTFILDFRGFSLKQFNDKAVINAGIQLITMYQDNYPENLKAAYLINVPSYFSWIFNIFKPFLNAVTLSKLKIYKTDDWKRDLGSLMDKELLPAFLGGKLTDPDGNPKCTSLITWESKVDPSYYLKQKQAKPDDPDMKSTVIQQRSIFQVPVDVRTKGSLMKWAFKTKEYNIRYGLFYKKSEKTLEEIIPVDNVDCQVVQEENEHVCEKAGTYVLYFDNSYSWMTAKQLYYKVDVESPEIIETNNN